MRPRPPSSSSAHSLSHTQQAILHTALRTHATTQHCATAETPARRVRILVNSCISRVRPPRCVCGVARINHSVAQHVHGAAHAALSLPCASRLGASRLVVYTPLLCPRDATPHDLADATSLGSCGPCGGAQPARAPCKARGRLPAQQIGSRRTRGAFMRETLPRERRRSCLANAARAPTATRPPASRKRACVATHVPVLGARCAAKARRRT